MTQTEIYEFLQSGSIIRLPSGKVRLWRGRFKPVDLKKSPVFSVAYMNFFDSELLALEAEVSVLETEVSELRRQLSSYLEANPSTTGFSKESFSEPSQTGFQEAFQIIQGKIHRGEVEKAVPIAFAETAQTPSSSDLAKMLFQALEAHSDLYVFGYWSEGQGILGATPEILFHQKNQTIRTMALAGTHLKPLPAPNEAQNKILKEALLKDPKELKEHRLVIEDIQKRLEKLGWVKVAQTEVIEFPTLYHLKTEIEAEVQTASPTELVKLLHPTAALGVAPRNYGIQWMRSLCYQEERGLFGAPIVFSISRTENLALVAIRSLIWDKNGSRVGSGCGLVEASQLQREWLELIVKRESVFKTLGLSL